MFTRTFGPGALRDPSLETLLTDGLGGFSLTGLAVGLTPPPGAG